MSKPIWIHVWQDNGQLERDADFSPSLADRDEVIDDDELWATYEQAMDAASVARQAVLSALRSPTPEEREAYRVHLIERDREVMEQT